MEQEIVWEDEIPDPKARKVLQELERAEADFYTVTGIAESTQIPESEVKNILHSARYKEYVRTPLVPTYKGKTLYTLRTRPRGIREYVSLAQQIIGY